MNSGQAREVEEDDANTEKVSREFSEQTETVASLVQRLGKPPIDLSEHLSGQFETLCQHLEQNDPQRVPKTDLHAWCLDADGLLLAVDSEDTYESLASLPERPTVAALVEEFVAELNRPRASQSDKRAALMSGLAEAGLEAHDALAETEHSDAEQERRDKIAEMLTTSLIDRFGAEAVESTEIDELAAKKRPQTRQQDRRFNWNLVLGFGTAVAVLAMLYTGYRLTAMRETRVASDSETSLTSPTNTSTSGRSGDDWRNPDVGEVAPLSPAANSVFNSDKERTTPMGALETLESLNNRSDRPDKAEVVEKAFDVSVDPSSLLAIDLPSGVVLPKSNAKESPKPKPNVPKDVRKKPAEKSGTLEEVLTDSAMEPEIPESPQRIRAADVQFVALPRALNPDKSAKVPGTPSDFESIEFPIDIPVRLDPPDAEGKPVTLVSLRDQEGLAEIRAGESGTQFAWTDLAKANSTAAQVHHGKIKLTGGGTIYMRPAIETDPMRLRLAVRDANPSWDIGWPILPKVSRLEIGVQAPDDIEYAWIEPFDPKNARRGRAIAVVTPPDGESVAIAVQFNVRCSSKLSCRLRYAARLDPSQPWQPLTKSSLIQISNSILSQRNSMATRRQTFQQFYDSADTTQRRMMRRKRDDMERAAEQLDATFKRIDLLRSLATTIEDQVRVSLRLSVQWPDGQSQTILQTTPTQEKPDEPGAG